MLLNDVGDRVEAACIALNDAEAFGHRVVPFIKKGGAYNLFAARDTTSDVREINRRASLFLSINQESYPLPVCDLPAMCGIDIKSERHLYWMRKGYVEEVFYLNGRRS
jgi:hypothetical protein